MGYCCPICKADPTTGEYSKCIGHKIGLKNKKKEQDEPKDKDDDDDGDGNDNNNEDYSKPPSNKRFKGNDDKGEGGDKSNNEGGWGTPSNQNWGNTQDNTGGWGSQFGESKELEASKFTDNDDDDYDVPAPRKKYQHNENKEGDNELNLMAYTGDIDDGDELFSDGSKVKIEDIDDEGVHKNWVAKDDPFRFEWKDYNDDSDDDEVKDVQKISKMTMYSDADWKE